MTKTTKKRRRAGITVTVTDEERAELRQAADKAGLALSIFVRVLLVNAVRRGDTVGTARAA